MTISDRNGILGDSHEQCCLRKLEERDYVFGAQAWNYREPFELLEEIPPIVAEKYVSGIVFVRHLDHRG